MVNFAHGHLILFGAYFYFTFAAMLPEAAFMPDWLRSWEPAWLQAYKADAPMFSPRAAIASWVSDLPRIFIGLTGALAANAVLALLIERCVMRPLLGLAPQMVDEIFGIIDRINREQGVSMLLVEQNANAAFRIAHSGYILENGKVVFEGTVDELRKNEDIQTFYLGVGEHEGQKFFRDIKHYKRRKRWLN